jgi:hypothetical protein
MSYRRCRNCWNEINLRSQAFRIRRHNIESMAVNGKCSSADIEAADKVAPILEYMPWNTFNTYENAMFYNVHPTRILAING